MNKSDFTSEQLQVINSAMTTSLFNIRGGVIPSIELSNKDYVQEVYNNLLKSEGYTQDILNNTNKNTQKHKHYTEVMQRIQAHKVNIQELIKEL